MKADLIDEDGEMSIKFEKCLNEIFDKFDINHDDCLDITELQAFAKATNHGKSLSQEDLTQITDFFDCNDSGALTRLGFAQMYHTQTVGDKNETWRDLTTHGYNHDLEH
jgi:Ca2+-binding EF-hand superfamily protein